MPTETELKLRIVEERAPGLAGSDVVRRFATGPSRRDHLVTTYYDTPELDLQRAGIVVRVRRNGDRFLHAVKSSGTGVAGLHSRKEIEFAAEGDFPDLGRLARASGFSVLRRKRVRETLARLFETDFVRIAWDLDWEDGSRLELAHDAGEVRHGEALTPLLEVELELREGSASVLYEVAERLGEVLDLQVESSSKAERGYALVHGRPPPPVTGRPVGLTPSFLAEDAYAAILSECLEQVHRNEKAVMHGDAVEGVHQMRVAWRRFRACLRAFRGQIPQRVSSELRDRIRVVNAVLGAARDWDVFVEEGLGPMHGEAPGAAYLHRAMTAAERKRSEAHADVRELLLSREWRQLLLTLAAWIHNRRWRGEMTDRERTASAQSLKEIAPRLLARAHKRLRRYPARLKRLEEEQLHQLRIEGKRLRYMAEFLGELYPGPQKDRYVKRLRRLQSALGRWHDAVVAVEIQREIGAEPDRPQIHAFFSGWYADECRTARRQMKKAWKKFRGTAPFWK